MSQPFKPPGSEEERIEPIDFRSPPPHRAIGNRTLIRWTAMAVAAVLLSLLGGAAWFVFSARQVLIQIDPEPESVRVRGGVVFPRMGAHFLFLPGEYTLTARKPCYREMEHRFQVGLAKSQQINLQMQKLPGKVEVRVHRDGHPVQTLEDARIRIDGREIGRTPLPTAVEVGAGVRQLEISADKYKTLARAIQVEGCGKLQEFDFPLVPGWSNLTLSSRPAGATLEVDGQEAGQTPIALELAEGPHELVLKAAGYKSWRRKLDIAAGEPLELELIELQPADGQLTVVTIPPGADVSIGKRPAGRTPLTLEVAPDEEHTVRISKKGFESATRTVRLNGAQSTSLSITLIPKTGIVRLDITPADAELWIDGARAEPAGKDHELSAVEHRLEIQKKGFETYRTRILPQPGAPVELRIALKPIARSEASLPSRIEAFKGYDLVLVSPSAFTMGSSRREQGRRSNETLRSIVLKRPFYMGVREVTNEEFRQFMADHDSGRQGEQDLNDGNLPVAQISWEQAALFCNWLSARESLPPAYAIKNGRLTAAEPLGTGYRLPTEAEWEYVARIAGRPGAAGVKFPWGDGFPPPRGSGNFADVSAKNVLAAYLETYDDGYPVAAPPAKFRANPLDLFDLGGNVAEWCHDYYQIYGTGKEFVDPTGPGEGRHHVVRGSSWKHGSFSDLRLAYRDYSDGKRPDLGFRVCRYAK